MARRVLDCIGPLDEAFFNANDDLDHCLKAHEAGFRNFTCADSVAYHWESQSGPARFAGYKAAEALFWTRWGNRHEVDLGRFVDEALDHVLDQNAETVDIPFEILDLSRGGDQAIILDRLAQRWPGIHRRLRSHRQFNNDATQIHLPLVLPHWVVADPTPFVYLVDRYRSLVENQLWFASRRRVVTDELVVDLTGVTLRTSEAFPT
jgi:hypothetical protein